MRKIASGVADFFMDLAKLTGSAYPTRLVRLLQERMISDAFYAAQGVIQLAVRGPEAKAKEVLNDRLRLEQWLTG